MIYRQRGNISRNYNGFGYEELEEYVPTRQLHSWELDVKEKNSFFELNSKRKKGKNNKKKIIGIACLLGVVAVVMVKLIVFNDSDSNLQINMPKQGVIITGSSTGSMNANDISESNGLFKASTIGIGGGGGMHSPLISPHNNEHMLLLGKKGGVYLTYDRCKTWARTNLNGVNLCAKYDPNKEGVIYVGGNGLYRSTDNGKTFDLIFPNKDDVIAKTTYGEDNLQYFSTKSKVYQGDQFVKDVAIDPEDSSHIFVLQFYGQRAHVFESTDNGESFRLLYLHDKDYPSDATEVLGKLLYKRETRSVYWVSDEYAIECTLEPPDQIITYYSEKRIEDATEVYDNGKTYFIVSENTDERDDSYTKVYYTSDFIEQVDITDQLVNAAPRTFVSPEGETISYKFRFKYVAATSLNNIFVSSYTFAENSNYPYSIDALIQLNNGEARHALGKPFRVRELLVDRGWRDGDLNTFGIGTSVKNNCEFLMTTDFGVYYAADWQHMYARYCTDVGNNLQSGYKTNGIDTQSGYKVCEDPSNKSNILIASIDAGLMRSTNKGNSWNVVNEGIDDSMKYTCYDVEYDKYKKGTVYSIWSAYNEAPTNTDINEKKAKGCFAISKDGGKKWDTKYSSGIPKNAIPCKMEIKFNGRLKKPTIYVATFNLGFYVSKDGGKTFKSMNKGLSKRGEKNYVYATDITVDGDDIYGLIGKSQSGDESIPCELYKYKKGKWQSVELPEDVQNVRDINIKKGTLYVSSVATPNWDYGENGDFKNIGGGLYTYKNRRFKQIFVDEISITSSVVDSKGTIYVSDIEGNIYSKTKNGKFTKIHNNFHYRSTNLNISKNGKRLYLSTIGGGVLKLEK